MKRTLWITLLMLIAFTGFSQGGWNWGEDKVLAQGNWNFANTNIKAGNYSEAVPKIQWLFKNTPDLHVNLYKQASKCYIALEKAEKEPETKKILQDTVLWIYDQRIKQFGGEATVLNYKGLVAYKYLVTREGQIPGLLTMYDSLFALNGDKSFANNALYYMDVAAKAVKAGYVSEDAFIDKYITCSGVIATQASSETNPKKLASYNRLDEKCTNTLISTVKMDCQRVISIFGPGLEQNPTDIKAAKLVYSLLGQNGCVANPLYNTAQMVIIEQEPSSGEWVKRAKQMFNQKKYNESLSSYSKALEFNTTESDKAAIYMDMAKIYSMQGIKSKARNNAEKATLSSDYQKEAYTFIGDLYMYSFEDCKTDDVLQTRAIYIAAYNMYQKAGNAKKMEEAKKNFPSGDDIFMRNKAVGDKVNTGCWINREVGLQKR